MPSKKIYCSFVLSLAAMLFFNFALAAENELSLTDVLQKITSQQKVSPIQDINCNDISDDDFEILGNAYMEQIHPGQQHELMDQMMGGEGSVALRNTHILMGQRYLGCGLVYSSGGMMGMMGPVMMGIYSGGATRSNDGYYGSAMMGTYGFAGKSLGTSWFWLNSFIMMILIWVILILIIAALIKWLKRK